MTRRARTRENAGRRAGPRVEYKHSDPEIAQPALAKRRQTRVPENVRTP